MSMPPQRTAAVALICVVLLHLGGAVELTPTAHSQICISSVIYHKQQSRLQSWGGRSPQRLFLAATELLKIMHSRIILGGGDAAWSSSAVMRLILY